MTMQPAAVGEYPAALIRKNGSHTTASVTAR